MVILVSDPVVAAVVPELVVVATVEMVAMEDRVHMVLVAADSMAVEETTVVEKPIPVVNLISVEVLEVTVM